SNLLRGQPSSANRGASSNPICIREYEVQAPRSSLARLVDPSNGAAFSREVGVRIHAVIIVSTHTLRALGQHPRQITGQNSDSTDRGRRSLRESIARAVDPPASRECL